MEVAILNQIKNFKAEFKILNNTLPFKYLLSFTNIINFLFYIKIKEPKDLCL